MELFFYLFLFARNTTYIEDITRWREDMYEPIEITSSINSRVRLWKINHSGPGCSFYEFCEWYLFQ